ncbi:hypothetical protein, partial [Parasutterella excrementihominis]|uniref:hypothetical protein n=1 Tax=Parasutterella excrementihominis TaxID=487175 RepID=UPI003FEEA0E3
VIKNVYYLVVTEEFWMKYGQFIKALKDKGVKVEERTRHLKLSYGGKQTGCKRHPAEEYPPMLLAKF